MALACGRIIEWIENIAPTRLAEHWDQIGLQIGYGGTEVRNVYLALDLDEQVIDEALAKDCQMIILHHPLIFKPLANLRWDNQQGRMIKRIVENDLQIYVAHTNLDIAQGGVNDVLATKVGLEKIEPLYEDKKDELVKIVVFVPLEDEEKVRQAMGDAGAGHIGQYSHCTFRTEGTGTFLPLDGANPHIGKVGSPEEVQEARLETIVSQRKLKRVLKALFKAHPYEEVAYDLYPLLNESKANGLGRIGYLAEPLSVQDFAEQVKKNLNITSLRWVGKDKNRKIQKVAVCGGSGGSTIGHARYKGADLLITGDLKYHDGQEALSLGMDLFDAGHFATENPAMAQLAEELREKAKTEKRKIQFFVHQKNQDPMCLL
ncbi:Nif3-like dinuclear metal center hexameric protein [Heliorestis acidaminivorans]|uniref:GTP cyclohydrolase 1 type 2 homolog n=1 Tax=Heliorestis acidaminivorans TaxID=553427 RepID=A0A6I0F0T1_9FIRM|nr:Nif3-like dinuclear metal center hexameric protein [Heliorestis acidaminivorans]KAB2954576.1 Nif3-like dinuclear metal center hexameric protein [Heliorestis acidaminivorans]